MMSKRILRWLPLPTRFRWLTIVLFVVLLVKTSPAAVIFTNNVTITETNLTYDGQDIIVDGATVTINGPHSFNSLLLTNNAVLTHSPCTTTNTHRLDLLVTNSVVVSTNSRIDASGKGYLPGRTMGNTTVGAATGHSGGSYGGLGGSQLGSANAVYGDYRQGDEWGSGGAGGNGRGGGRVRLVAGALQLEGQLLGNGAVDYYGSGSGGGIYVAVASLKGGGSIQVNGGGYGPAGQCGGGGGRIALYAGDWSGFNLLLISCCATR